MRDARRTTLGAIGNALRELRINRDLSVPPYVEGSFQKDMLRADDDVRPIGKRRASDRLTQSAADIPQPLVKRAASPALDQHSAQSLPSSRSESHGDLTTIPSWPVPGSPLADPLISASAVNPSVLFVKPYTHHRRVPSHQLNPYEGVYGLDGLRAQLTNYVLPVLEGDELLADNGAYHMFWSYTPYGSGVFTLIDNFCRFHSINMLHVSTRAPRNNDNICSNVAYEDGQYRDIMFQAIAMAPCILLIDRIDPHFSIEYVCRGIQLVNTWDAIVEQSDGSIPKVWTVISSSASLASLYRFTINPFKRFHGWETGREPLSASECVNLMMQTTAAQITSANIQADDRPNPPAVETEEAQRAYREELQRSAFMRILGQQRSIVEPIGRALHSHVLLCTPEDAPTPYCVEPHWLHTAVVAAFRRASERYRSQRRSSPTTPTRSILLPTREDLLDAIHHIPTPLVEEFARNG